MDSCLVDHVVLALFLVSRWEQMGRGNGEQKDTVQLNSFSKRAKHYFTYDRYKLHQYFPHITCPGNQLLSFPQVCCVIMDSKGSQKAMGLHTKRKHMLECSVGLGPVFSIMKDGVHIEG